MTLVREWWAGDKSSAVVLQRASSCCRVSTHEARWRQPSFIVTARHLQTGCHMVLIVVITFNIAFQTSSQNSFIHPPRL